MFTKIYDSVLKFIKENYVFLLIILIFNLLFYVELPYVIETPGGSIVLNERIEVEDGYETAGTMGMAYVSMVKGNIPFLLASFIIPDWDIVAKSTMKYDNETMDDVYARDRLYLQEAIDNATIAAFKEADKQIVITKEKANVAYIDEQAETDLKIGDVIVKLEGQDVASLDDLKHIVEEIPAGKQVVFDILRDGKEKQATAKVYATDEGVKVGVSLIITYDYDLANDVDIKTKASESGPSGGMMMALMIYNSLTEEDITKGRYIIGTGEINEDGKVGEIGGVKYKLIGAQRKGADVFLCPMANLQEALAVKEEKGYDIEIKGVLTLQEAIEYLKNGGN